MTNRRKQTHQRKKTKSKIDRLVKLIAVLMIVVMLGSVVFGLLMSMSVL